MSKVTRPLTSLTKHMTSYALIMLLAFVVGCAEVTPDDTGNSPWVPASVEIQQSLGVSTWYVETLDGGTTRIVGYDQSDSQLSEMKISTPILNQILPSEYVLFADDTENRALLEMTFYQKLIEGQLNIIPEKFS